MTPSEDLIRATYERIKRENPRMPEGDVLSKTARILEIPRDRVGEILREPVPVKRYLLICRHNNLLPGGN
jgi:hypothetical protein